MRLGLRGMGLGMGVSLGTDKRLGEQMRFWGVWMLGMVVTVRSLLGHCVMVMLDHFVWIIKV